MPLKVKNLEEELESERSTLEIIKEKSDKSHNEIIQLNKGNLTELRKEQNLYDICTMYVYLIYPFYFLILD